VGSTGNEKVVQLGPVKNIDLHSDMRWPNTDGQLGFDLWLDNYFIRRTAKYSLFSETDFVTGSAALGEWKLLAIKKTKGEFIDIPPLSSDLRQSYGSPVNWLTTLSKKRIHSSNELG
jgi:hypothetical protein